MAPVLHPVSLLHHLECPGEQFLARAGHSLWPFWTMSGRSWHARAFWPRKDAWWLKTVVTTLIVSSSVALLYGVVQTFTGIEWLRGIDIYPAGNFHRSIGFFSHQLTFAGFAMTIFFLASSWAVNRIAKLSWTVPLAVLAFLAVVATFARGMWVVLVSGSRPWAF